MTEHAPPPPSTVVPMTHVPYVAGPMPRPIPVLGRRPRRRTRRVGAQDDPCNVAIGCLMVMGMLCQVWLLAWDVSWTSASTWAPTLAMAVYLLGSVLFACFKCDPPL